MNDTRPTAAQRRIRIGAEVLPGEGAHFRVWAPKCKRVEVVLQERNARSLEPGENGYFAGFVPQAQAGDRYRRSPEWAGSLDQGTALARLPHCQRFEWQREVP